MYDISPKELAAFGMADIISLMKTSFLCPFWETTPDHNTSLLNFFFFEKSSLWAQCHLKSNFYSNKHPYKKKIRTHHSKLSYPLFIRIVIFFRANQALQPYDCCSELVFCGYFWFVTFLFKIVLLSSCWNFFVYFFCQHGGCHFYVSF